MDINQTKTVLNQIKTTSLTSLQEDIFKYAVRYARIRTDWCLLSLDERKGLDSTRTKAHNAFIDSCNILSRNMKKVGEDNNWRATLGEDRKTIGDFACYIHCILGLEAR